MLAGFSPNLHAFRPKPAASDAPYSVARSGEFRGASHETAPYNFMRDSTELPNYRQAMGHGRNWFASALQASATVLGMAHFPLL